MGLIKLELNCGNELFSSVYGKIVYLDFDTSIILLQVSHQILKGLEAPQELLVSQTLDQWPVQRYQFPLVFPFDFCLAFLLRQAPFTTKL